MKLFGRLVLRVVLLVTLLLVLIQAYFFLQICWWINYNPSSTSFMRQQLEILQEKNPNAKLQQKWLPYERISKNLKRAIIAAEDAHFSDHDGIDWNALEKAYEKNSKRGRVVSGGSTITQQLAKNLFLSGQKSYIRKGEELIIAMMLEVVMDKERIFEIYLNVVEWGNGVFGAEAASRHYYGISAGNLGAEQAARLAVMLPNPRYYDQHRGSAYLQKRTNLIIRRMGASALP